MRVNKDIQYSKESNAEYRERKTFDIYSPITPFEYKTLLIYTHGGAWTTASKDQFSNLGNKLSSLGITTCIFNYRLSKKTESNDIRYPLAYIDVAEAVEFIRKNITDLTGQVFTGSILVGHSCGVHLNLMAMKKFMSTASVAYIKRTICIEGIYNIKASRLMYPTWNDWFLKFVFDKDFDEDYDLKNGKVSVLVVHSGDDELVDEKSALEFYNGYTYTKEYAKISGSHDGVLETDQLHGLLLKEIKKIH
jgi:hypothetical protein